jgi:hypothetical protein
MVTPEALASAVAAVIEVLGPRANAAEWSSAAGDLEWNCWEMAAHVAHDLTAHALQIAAARQEGYLPVDLAVRAHVPPSGLLVVIESTARCCPRQQPPPPRVRGPGIGDPLIPAGSSRSAATRCSCTNTTSRGASASTGGLRLRWPLPCWLDSSPTRRRETAKSCCGAPAGCHSERAPGENPACRSQRCNVLAPPIQAGTSGLRPAIRRSPGNRSPTMAV